VADVVSLEWETYPDDVVATPVDHGPNIDIDDHPTVPPNGGKRIFPGKKDYDDTAEEADMRRKVNLKVTISSILPGLPSEGMPVYLRPWDVDDPSANDSGLPEAQCTWPLDCDDMSHSHWSESWRYDNRNPSIKEFCFAESGTQPFHVPPGTDNIKVPLYAWMYPGDNCRVTGSIVQCNMPPEVTWQKVDSDSGLPSYVENSEMLTVWRKLHIERDYMAPVPSTGAEKNRITGTADSYTYDGVSKTEVDLGQNMPGNFDDDDQFEGGWYFAFPNWYPVISFVDSWWDDEIIVEGDPAGDGASMAYTLFDDDDQNLFNSPYYVSLDSKEKNAFREAYIEPNYLPPTWSDAIPFNLNLTEYEMGKYPLGDHEVGQDISSSSNFWACLAVGAYQGETDGDQDPDGCGTGPPASDPVAEYGMARASHSSLAMFLEVIHNEPCAQYRTESEWLAHEMGHTAGAPDHVPENCYMNVNIFIGPLPNEFCDECLAIFRSNTTW
jgi:hypothetical protein